MCHRSTRLLQVISRTRRTDFCVVPYAERMANPTGFSAPPSLPDGSALNISSSSGSTVLQPAPTKKQKFAPAAEARANATLAVPALVATSQNVKLHNASQTQLSYGSDVSVISSIERQRRYDLARAKRELAELRVQEADELAHVERELAQRRTRTQRELAEARVNEAQTRLALSSGSRTGSVGRLDDVRSESEASVRVDHATDVRTLPVPRPAHVSQTDDSFDLLYTQASSSLTVQVVHPQPLAAAETNAPTPEPAPFAGVFSAARWEQPSTSDLVEVVRQPTPTPTTDYTPFATNWWCHLSAAGWAAAPNDVCTKSNNGQQRRV